jgi:hypothetical protein
MYIFVTSAAYDGNLGSISGANQKCQQEAAAAGLPGVYFAWISKQGGTTPIKRFIKSYVTPYVRTDGTIISYNWTYLTANPFNPLNAIINKDASGNLISDADVWSDTDYKGDKITASTTATCNDWTLDQITGPVGWTNRTDQYWTEADQKSCTELAHLYCFRQAI